MQENLLYTLKESNLLNTNITAPAQVLASCLRERSVPGVCIIYFCNIHSCWPPAAAPLHRWLGFSTFSIIIKVQVLFCSTLKKYWLLAGQVDTADSPKHHSISRLKAPHLPPPTLTFGISHLAASRFTATGDSSQVPMVTQRQGPFQLQLTEVGHHFIHFAREVCIM